MEKEITDEKSCENCRYFSQHYSKQRLKYDTVYCGHCLNLNNKKIKPLSPGNCCGYWENTEAAEKERKKLIKDVLDSMSKVWSR